MKITDINETKDLKRFDEIMNKNKTSVHIGIWFTFRYKSVLAFILVVTKCKNINRISQEPKKAADYCLINDHLFNNYFFKKGEQNDACEYFEYILDNRRSFRYDNKKHLYDVLMF